MYVCEKERKQRCWAFSVSIYGKDQHTCSCDARGGTMGVCVLEKERKDVQRALYLSIAKIDTNTGVMHEEERWVCV